MQTLSCCDTGLLALYTKILGFLQRSISESYKLNFHKILVWKRLTENQLGLAAGSRTNQWTTTSDVDGDDSKQWGILEPYLGFKIDQLNKDNIF